MVLQLVPVVQKSIELIFDLQFDYTRMNEVMTLVKQYNCTVLQQEMQLFCQLRIGIPKARLEEMLYKLNDMHTVEVNKVKL